MPAHITLSILLCSCLNSFAAATLTWVVLRRLSRIQPAGVQKAAEVPVLFRVFLPIARLFVPWLSRPELERVRSKTDARLVQAGRDQLLSPEEFLGLRLVYAAVFAVLAAVFMGTGVRLLAMFGFVLLVFGLVFPQFWLYSQIRVRHRAMQRALPNVLDLLTLSVEAGRDFLTALRDILQHREPDALGEELERVFREVQLGKQRRQALRNMAARVQQADLTLVVETLAQADELGVSIGHILRILGDQMRQKRFQHAEKLANESPVKLLFPLFVFIFPAVIIVMLGPVLMRSLNYMMR